MVEKALSDDDMRRYINHVITYSDLSNFTSQNLLKSLPLVVLYQTTENRGHWILLHKFKDGVEFFDPYSFKPDTEFKLIRPEMQQNHHLATLLYDLNVPIYYNHLRFQEFSPGINTCGRWVILRNMFSSVPLETFYTALTSLAQDFGQTLDQLVVDLVA